MRRARQFIIACPHRPPGWVDMPPSLAPVPPGAGPRTPGQPDAPPQRPGRSGALEQPGAHVAVPADEAPARHTNAYPITSITSETLALPSTNPPDRRLRVAFLITQSEIGGAQAHVLDLLRALRGRVAAAAGRRRRPAAGARTRSGRHRGTPALARQRPVAAARCRPAPAPARPARGPPRSGPRAQREGRRARTRGRAPARPARGLHRARLRLRRPRRRASGSPRAPANACWHRSPPA